MMRKSLSTLFLGLSAFALTSISANAAFVVNITEVGSDVVATGTGSIDTAALHYLGSESSDPYMVPSGDAILLGLTGQFGVYGASINGPASFGSGGDTHASSGLGDLVGVAASGGELAVPVGYVSGAPLTDSTTFDNATFASLGLTPGTYTFTLRSPPIAPIPMWILLRSTSEFSPRPSPRSFSPWRSQRKCFCYSRDGVNAWHT